MHLTIPQGEQKASLCLIISLQVLIHKAESSSVLNLCTILDTVLMTKCFTEATSTLQITEPMCVYTFYMNTRSSVCIKRPPLLTHSIIYECTYHNDTQDAISMQL